MKTWHWLLVGAGAYFFTDGFKNVPLLGGKDSNDAVGSRNEVSPKVLEVGEGTVLRPTDPAEGGEHFAYAGGSPGFYDPNDPNYYGGIFVQRDKEGPLWRDLTSGGGFGGGINPPSYGIPGSELFGFAT